MDKLKELHLSIKKISNNSQCTFEDVNIARTQLFDLIKTNIDGSLYEWGGEVDVSKKCNREFRTWFHIYVRKKLIGCPEIWDLQSVWTFPARASIDLSSQEIRFMVDAISLLHRSEKLPPYVLCGIFFGSIFRCSKWTKGLRKAERSDHLVRLQRVCRNEDHADICMQLDEADEFILDIWKKGLVYFFVEFSSHREIQ
mmetsp:Transcript_4537/g.5619  ORF Transcript_4537/g.5619 Transcript_4537/m.5619 type:complete len:198 (-) Transcript_4537:67-660(-)